MVRVFLIVGPHPGANTFHENLEKVGDFNIVRTSPISISVDDVTFTYRRLNPNFASMKSLLVKKKEPFYLTRKAIDRISFQIKSGEVVGVIGGNGSGKSTLLRLLSGLYPPDLGRVRTWGTVAPLMDLGAGFHPELNSLENIKLNSALLGHGNPDTAEILSWANLSEFALAPIRTFSSGMVARLAFSIATQVVPDILLIDEVLSVGDIQFQEKSLARMQNMLRGGSTVVLVSHNLDLLKKETDRCIWLEGGRLLEFDKSSKVIKNYLENCKFA